MKNLKRVLGIAFLITITACGSSASLKSTSIEEIVGIVWLWSEWVEIEPTSRSVVSNPEDYTLVLEANGSFQAQVDCNMVQGTYITIEDEIHFDIGLTTLANCGPDSLYDDFLTLLSQVSSFGLRSNDLVLVLESDSGEMSFQNGGSEQTGEMPKNLVNIQWMWSEMRVTSPAAQSVVTDPANYTITLRDGGVLNVKADCNVANGVYRIDGENIHIELGAMTLAFCGDDSLSDQFVQFLSAAETFAVGGDGLLLHLEDNSGTMKFISS